MAPLEVLKDDYALISCSMPRAALNLLKALMQAATSIAAVISSSVIPALRAVAR